MKKMQVQGVHHITLVGSSKQSAIDFWEGALGMPLQNILTSEANARIARSGRTDLQFAPVGQIVGRMNQVRPVRDVIYGLVEEYIETVERLEAGVEA